MTVLVGVFSCLEVFVCDEEYLSVSVFFECIFVCVCVCVFVCVFLSVCLCRCVCGG